jgi:hypothetical protein
MTKIGQRLGHERPLITRAHTCLDFPIGSLLRVLDEYADAASKAAYRVLARCLRLKK